MGRGGHINVLLAKMALKGGEGGDSFKNNSILMCT